jgi:phytanoyl-CoA hydroxylase
MTNANNTTPLSYFKQPQEVLAFYNEHGYHIEHDIFSPQECSVLIEAAGKLENAKNGSYRPTMMPHRHDEIFVIAMRKKAIATIISELVGGEPAGIQSEFFYCKPGTRGFSLHQDNFYVEAAQGVFASAWCALTDTYFEKGGLIVYPGTHVEGNLPVRKLDLKPDTAQDPNANNEETIVPPQYKAINATVPKGAVLFLHGHTVHASNPNKTDEWRYVLLNTYIKKGEKFRPGNYAKRAEVDLMMATELVN